jgi:heavy metal translocating P-type ATPase
MTATGHLENDLQDRGTCAHCDLPLPVNRGRRAAPGLQFCCFGCRIAREMARPATSGGAVAPGGTLLLRLGMGIFLAMNIMVFNWFTYSREWFGPDAAVPGEYAGLAALFSYLLMFLATAVLALLGVPILGDVLAGWRRGVRIDANLLILVGVTSAYAVSVAHTVRGDGSLYYDTTAMVLVLVTLGNYLEAGAKRRATSSAGALLASVPTRAWARRDGEVVEIDAADLAVGDHVRVRAGEAVPVDGRVIEGTSQIDEAILTGESRPRQVDPGDRLLAGSLNLSGQLWLEARHVGEDRAISRMQRMLDEARLHQPPIQRVADRIAAVFVPGVVLLATVVFAIRAWNGSPLEGLFVALTVLLISCPCALGLAAPLATWSALRRAAERGILIDSAVTLERAARVGRLFFDKTGTLTEPQLKLDRIVAADDVAEADALRWVAALETTSVHPIGRALVHAAEERAIGLPAATDAVTVPGLGVEARVDGVLLRLGSHRLVERSGLARAPGATTADDETTIVYLMDESRVLASLHVAEVVRPDAPETIASLRDAGVEVSVLTGDQAGPARRLARDLDLPVEAGLLPADKLDRLRSARAEASGTRPGVGMVGDGINDAPVLAAADVGFAMGSASDLAKQAGNIRLIFDRLDRVPIALAIARSGMRRVKWSLGWAFGYNGIGLTLATMGMLTPIFAASAMFVSSLVVVAISRGAGRIDLREATDE